jgi:protein tyrosine/serine phosphatase
MPRPVRWCFTLLLLALLIAGPIGYAKYRLPQLRNFRVVEEGVLYRSGQLTLSGLKQVIHDYGIKTIVTLRDPVTPKEGSPDRAEEQYCTTEELNYVRIPPKHWWSAQGPAPAEEGVRKFRAIMADQSNYPVLIHCFAGTHRTGAYCAIYRMEHDHWSNAKAIEELKACGYENLDDEWDILGYLEQYRPTWAPPVEKDQAALRRPPFRSPRRPKRRPRKSAASEPRG